METEEGRFIQEAATKRKRYEVACGWRKGRRKDEFRPEKCEHSPTVTLRTQNPSGFYSEDWDESQQDWMIGRCQINGREYLRWCFMADT